MNTETIVITGGMTASLLAMLYILKNYSGRPAHFIQDGIANVPLFALVSLLALPAGLFLMLPYVLLKRLWQVELFQEKK